ncbi:flagellin [Roseovarius sp. SYSU LYC5161]|uniref:flagellin n=1 Tax=Roseovarius halophilus (ex Wu et al. 2025) TaxID=3376060 RepID=UPI0028711775|nr:flagellin [Roseovarius sp.]
MNFTSVGDLAQTLVQSRSGGEVKARIGRLTNELSSGIAQDVPRHLSGNLDQLAHLERRLGVTGRYRTAAALALSDMSVMQSSLDRVQSLGQELAGRAAAISTMQNPPTVAVLGDQARGALSEVVAAMNAQNAGRALFAGADVDGQVLAPSEDILALARAAVSGATTAADVRAELDSFFAAGGTFETDVFRGTSAGDLTYKLDAGETITAATRADDAVIRDVLANMMSVALADDPALTLDDAQRRDLASGAGTALMGADTELAEIRGGLGTAEAQAERSAARLEAEATSLRTARQELVGIDRFATASELEAAQGQLETIFTVAARSASLSLVNFL